MVVFIIFNNQHSTHDLILVLAVDYSLRNILAEMAYVPLSFEARFKGKEIIAVFANRFGKSGMALILSGLHFSSGGGVGLSGLTLFATLGWLTSAVSLSKLILSKEEAEQLVSEQNSSSNNEENISNGDADDEHRKEQ